MLYFSAHILNLSLGKGVFWACRKKNASLQQQQQQTFPWLQSGLGGTHRIWFWMSLSGTQSNNVARPWKPSLSLLAVSQESQHKGGVCLRARPLVSVGSRSVYPENKSNTLHKGDAGGCLHGFLRDDHLSPPLPSVKEIIAIYFFSGQTTRQFLLCLTCWLYTPVFKYFFVLHNENLFLWPAQLKRQSEMQTDGLLCPTIRCRKTLTKNRSSTVISCYQKDCTELISNCVKTYSLSNLFWNTE